MPYQNNKDLPASVKQQLPPQAQAVYREAFNRAWYEYGHLAMGTVAGVRERSREEMAHTVAWATVHKVCEREEALDPPAGSY